MAMLPVYDLRYDQTAVVGMNEEQLKKAMFASWAERQEGLSYNAVKQLQYNRCPAIAPISVLSQGDGWEKISLDKSTIDKHLDVLIANPAFC